ncbi:MAG TPA: calcium/proton exchanger [Armatimonadota bacterium]|jgi:Ca2+:H+ antiporter
MRGRGKQANTTPQLGLWSFIAQNRLNWLLLFLPVSMLLHFAGVAQLWVFFTSALAIVPLAGLIGRATEEIAESTGPALGGLLNATFGNATELIIALLALRAGLDEVVKASISGSIIGNILLVLGLSMFVGGWGRDKQRFSRTNAGASASMLMLAVVALVMPAVFDLTMYGSLNAPPPGSPLPLLSLLVAIVLILIYLASLIFSLRTHRMLFAPPGPARPHAELSRRNAVLLLSITTVLVALESELLVSSIEAATSALHMTKFFVGVIVVAVIGNAAEHFSAVSMARKDKMDLAMTIATASSTQIALFVAPVLVFASFLFGTPMTLVFNPFEIVGIALSVLLLSVVSLDGESNWFEGLQLVAVYLVFGIVFYFVR